MVWAEGWFTLPLPNVLSNLLPLISPLVALTVWSNAVLAQGPGGRAYPLFNAGPRGLSLFPMKLGSMFLLLDGLVLELPRLVLNIMCYFGPSTRPFAIPKLIPLIPFNIAAAETL